MADSPPDVGTPRWVKAFGMVAIVLVVLVIIMLVTGHGPGSHTASGDAGGRVAVFGVVAGHTALGHG